MSDILAAEFVPRFVVKTSGMSFMVFKVNSFMPWYNGTFPPSYKNQPVKLREKAVEIANELLTYGANERVAIATGLKRAREFFAREKALKEKKNHSLNTATWMKDQSL